MACLWRLFLSTLGQLLHLIYGCINLCERRLNVLCSGRLKELSASLCSGRCRMSRDCSCQGRRPGTSWSGSMWDPVIKDGILPPEALLSSTCWFNFDGSGTFPLMRAQAFYRDIPYGGFYGSPDPRYCLCASLCFFGALAFLPTVFSLRFGRWANSDKEASGCSSNLRLRTGMLDFRGSRAGG